MDIDYTTLEIPTEHVDKNPFVRVVVTHSDSRRAREQPSVWSLRDLSHVASTTMSTRVQHDDDV